MVSPVQFTNSPRIHFKGNEDLINAPGAFEQPAQAVPETPSDEIVLSNKPDAEKKGGIGKTIAKAIGGIVVLAGALFGLYKWKGVHGDWLNKEAQTTGAKIKNALVKPGEWLDNTFKSIGKKLGLGGSKATEAAAGDAAATGAKAGEEAVAGAETAAAKAGEEAAAGAEATAAKAGEEVVAGAETAATKAGEEAAAGAETFVKPEGA
jgi:hypothetical protein